MVRLVTARNGQLSAQANGRMLYSRYNPTGEAVRYAERELSGGNKGRATVLILGAGLGYLTEAVRNAFAPARVIAVHLNPELFGKRICDADQQWCSGASVQTFGTFLNDHLPDEEIEGLLLLQWEPCIAAFREQAEAVVPMVRDFLDQRSATLATERHFGPRWVKNSVANALEMFAQKRVKGARTPVIIAAAGPSLHESLGAISQRDHGVALWSLPSALPILLDAGCQPDLVITTDAGFYAAHHLRPLPAFPAIPLAAPLSAFTPALLRRRPAIVLNQGSWFEHDLLTNCKIPWVQLPPHGTVAGTAWYLAAALESTEVVFAGLDLCTLDVRSHPRGHAFEALLRPAARRLRPYHHILFERNVVPADRVHAATTARSSRALRTYAAWFRDQGASMPVRASRLAPSAVELGLPECSRLPRCSRAQYALLNVHGESGDRRQAVTSCVRQWRSRVAGLRSALLAAETGRDEFERRLVSMARTIDTAGYLRTVGAIRRTGAWGSAGQRLQDQLERFFDELLRRVEQSS